MILRLCLFQKHGLLKELYFNKMAQQYTGSKFFAELVGVDMPQIAAAFSFYSGFNNSNLVPPDSWASGSNTGVVNNTGIFFSNSGTGTFNGNTYMSLSGSHLLDNSIIYISYEKLRTGDEILLSSAEGNNFNNYSGFCLGINDANKLYFKYWNPIEGSFAFTYSGILANKNLIYLNKNSSIITLGHFNNNQNIFETQDFEIFQNSFVEGGNLKLGGHQNYINWINNTAENFSGYIDKFFLYKDTVSLYKNILVSGLFANPTGYAGSYVTNCFITGGLVNSGFSYTGVTGIGIVPFISGITGITGYSTGISGYSYSGITGYNQIYLGFFIDNCGNSGDIFNSTPISGLITKQIIVNNALTGVSFISGFNQVQLTGRITGSTLVSVSGEFCDIIFQPDGSVEYQISDKFLSSLSYNEISLLSQVRNDNDILELYYTNYEPKFLEYNRSLIFDSLNENYFYFDRNLNRDEILLFANGQALIESGYSLIPSGYQIIQRPNLDYFITGNTVETNKLYALQDQLFYDYITGKFYATKINGIFSSGYAFTNPTNQSQNIFVYLNGQKLIRNINYELISSGSPNNIIKITKQLTGDNFIIVKEHPSNFDYISGNVGTLPILKKVNHDTTQLYFNGIKQKLNSNYLENSVFDLISGTYIEKDFQALIYNDTEDFFLDTNNLIKDLSSSSSSRASDSSSSSFVASIQSSSSSSSREASSSSSIFIINRSSSSSSSREASSSSSSTARVSSSSSSLIVVGLSSSSSINATLSSSSSQFIANQNSSSSIIIEFSSSSSTAWQSSSSSDSLARIESSSSSSIVRQSSSSSSLFRLNDWTLMNVGANYNWTALGYGNNFFIGATAGTGAAFSSNGINWTVAPLPLSKTWVDIEYADNRYRFLPRNDRTGIDLISGSFFTYDLVEVRDWNDIAYSPQLSGWLSVWGASKSVVWGQDKFVIAVDDNVGDSGAYFTAVSGLQYFPMPTARRWRSVTYGSGIYVMTATSANKCAYSYNGINWTETDLPLTANWSKVVYGEGRFYAMPNLGNRGAYSFNGINWSEFRLPINNRWANATYGNGMFVATSNQGIGAINPSSGAYYYIGNSSSSSSSSSSIINASSSSSSSIARDSSSSSSSSSMFFVSIGDGNNSPYTDEALIATSVQSLNPAPDFIIHHGDINQENIQSSFVNNVVPLWQGSQLFQKMYISFGNHDLDNPEYGDFILNYLTATRDAIGATKRNNKFYCYDFVKGPCHFFVINTGNTAIQSNGEAGDALANIQAQLDEMIPKILASNSIWKIFVCHRPPYTNDEIHRRGFFNYNSLFWQNITSRLNFANLGIQIVLNGHGQQYSVFEKDGVYFIQNGAGGATRRNGIAPFIPETVTVINQKAGYVKYYVTSSQFKWEFIDVEDNNNILDSRTVIRIYTQQELNNFSSSSSSSVVTGQSSSSSSNFQISLSSSSSSFVTASSSSSAFWSSSSSILVSSSSSASSSSSSSIVASSSSSRFLSSSSSIFVSSSSSAFWSSSSSASTLPSLSSSSSIVISSSSSAFWSSSSSIIVSSSSSASSSSSSSRAASSSSSAFWSSSSSSRALSSSSSSIAVSSSSSAFWSSSSSILASSSNSLLAPSSSSSSSIIVLGICQNLTVQSANIGYSSFGGIYSGNIPYTATFQDGITFTANTSGRAFFRLTNSANATNGDFTYIRLRQSSATTSPYWTPIESGTLNGAGSVTGSIYLSSGQNLLFGYEREGFTFPSNVTGRLDYLYLVCTGVTGDSPIPIYIKYLSNYE